MMARPWQRAITSACEQVHVVRCDLGTTSLINEPIVANHNGSAIRCQPHRCQIEDTFKVVVRTLPAEL